MKKRILTGFLVLFGLLPLIGMYGQGFTGPNAAANSSQVRTVTVAEANNLMDKSLVKLTGSIVQSLSRDKFLFRDSSGEVTIKIDRELWALTGLTLNATDRVEIGGKFDIKKQGAEVKVKTLRKL